MTGQRGPSLARNVKPSPAAYREAGEASFDGRPLDKLLAKPPPAPLTRGRTYVHSVHSYGNYGNVSLGHQGLPAKLAPPQPNLAQPSIVVAYTVLHDSALVLKGGAKEGR